MTTTLYSLLLPKSDGDHVTGDYPHHCNRRLVRRHSLTLPLTLPLGRVAGADRVGKWLGGVMYAVKMIEKKTKTNDNEGVTLTNLLLRFLLSRVNRFADQRSRHIADWPVLGVGHLLDNGA